MREYLVNRYEREKQRDEELKETLDAVRKYPEYRAQSIKIQQMLEERIDSLREQQKEQHDLLEQIQSNSIKLERNKLRDRLLQSYRFYTNPQTNTTQSWSQMEAEAFWELFKEYEDRGGNGYVHSVVQPAMNELAVRSLEDLHTADEA